MINFVYKNFPGAAPKVYGGISLANLAKLDSCIQEFNKIAKKALLLIQPLM